MKRRILKRRVRFYSHLEHTERALITRALAHTRTTKADVTKTAKILGLPLSTLKYKMKKFKLSR